MLQARLDYEQSCDRLRQAGWVEPTDALPMPKAMPRFDDDGTSGVRFFRTQLEDADGKSLSNLTLPRTFIARSQVGPASFANTDLSESCLWWNDFADVDFAGADLSRADLRASSFTRVRFIRATLAGADLRHAEFVECEFDQADTRGMILAQQQRGRLPSLSSE